MKVDDILDQYGINRDNALAYILAITQKNQKETGETMGVTGQHINQTYKHAFNDMTAKKQALVMLTLLREHYMELTD